ncbi:MAG: glycosyltransferase family 4 protein [Gemmatimonadetes bacterium]|nr:glycosyltransferase family 4 protein [Gemmatimonadota bacterium]
MRIAYVCADAGIPVFGTKGASVHVQGVVSAMRREGHDVTLVAARAGGSPPAALSELPVLLVEPAAATTAAQRERAMCAVDARIAEILTRQGPFDLVYERYSLWGTAGMSYARRHGVPGILEVNAPLIEEQRTHRELVDVAGAERVAASAFADAALLVAVSQPVARYLRDQPTRRAPVLVVPNGIDPTRFPTPAFAGGRAGRPFTLGFLGTLKPWHGLDALVESFAFVRAIDGQARLLIVGDGPERAALAADLERRGLTDAATITGAVRPEEVAHHLAAMDVALAPYPASGDAYFSPLKVVEYLAAGVPVVASRTGQLPELVRHGVTGLLVPPGDARATASACNRLRLDRALALSMAREGRREALATRTWDAAVRRIIAVARHPLPRMSSLVRPGAGDAVGVPA